MVWEGAVVAIYLGSYSGYRALSLSPSLSPLLASLSTPISNRSWFRVQVTYLPVLSGSGLVDLEELEAAIRPDTVACSVMAVNNEIGVVQPLKEIGEICRKNKVFFHSDIAQMLGKVGVLEGN